MVAKEIAQKFDRFFQTRNGEPAWSSFLLESLFTDVNDDGAVLQGFCAILEARQPPLSQVVRNLIRDVTILVRIRRRRPPTRWLLERASGNTPAVALLAESVDLVD